MQRRRWGKAVRRNEKAAKAGRIEAVLAETGIRALREKPVFTTPNVFPPDEFEQVDVERSRVPRGRRAAALLRLQAATTRRPPLLRPALPGVRATSTTRKRTETADLRGRVALLTGGRVKIGYQAGHQAAARRRAADRHHALPARLRRRATRASPTSRSGATGSRSSASTCATRRASRRSAAHLLATRDRLDFIVNNACQTVRRPPDFYAHMMERETALGATHARARAAAARRATRACAATTCCRRATALPARRAGCRAGGLTHAAELSQVPLLPGGARGAGRPLPRGPARPGPAAGRPARAQLLAAAARRGAVGRAARGAARQRRRAVRAERAAQAADAAHARARQAHRQRLGGGGAVLPQVQDRRAPAHEHGQGRAQHDDAHLGGRLRTPTAST